MPGRRGPRPRTGKQASSSSSLVPLDSAERPASHALLRPSLRSARVAESMRGTSSGGCSADLTFDPLVTRHSSNRTLTSGALLLMGSNSDGADRGQRTRRKEGGGGDALESEILKVGGPRALSKSPHKRGSLEVMDPLAVSLTSNLEGRGRPKLQLQSLGTSPKADGAPQPRRSRGGRGLSRSPSKHGLELPGLHLNGGGPNTNSPSLRRALPSLSPGSKPKRAMACPRCGQQFDAVKALTKHSRVCKAARPAGLQAGMGGMSPKLREGRPRGSRRGLGGSGPAVPMSPFGRGKMALPFGPMSPMGMAGGPMNRFERIKRIDRMKKEAFEREQAERARREREQSQMQAEEELAIHAVEYWEELEERQRKEAEEAAIKARAAAKKKKEDDEFAALAAKFASDSSDDDDDDLSGGGAARALREKKERERREKAQREFEERKAKRSKRAQRKAERMEKLRVQKEEQRKQQDAARKLAEERRAKAEAAAAAQRAAAEAAAKAAAKKKADMVAKVQSLKRAKLQQLGKLKAQRKARQEAEAKRLADLEAAEEKAKAEEEMRLAKQQAETAALEAELRALKEAEEKREAEAKREAEEHAAKLATEQQALADIKQAEVAAAEEAKAAEEARVAAFATSQAEAMAWRKKEEAEAARAAALRSEIQKQKEAAATKTAEREKTQQRREKELAKLQKEAATTQENAAAVLASVAEAETAAVEAIDDVPAPAGQPREDKSSVAATAPASVPAPAPAPTPAPVPVPAVEEEIEKEKDPALVAAEAAAEARRKAEAEALEVRKASESKRAEELRDRLERIKSSEKQRAKAKAAEAAAAEAKAARLKAEAAEAEAAEEKLRAELEAAVQAQARTRQKESLAEADMTVQLEAELDDLKKLSVLTAFSPTSATKQIAAAGATKVSVGDATKSEADAAHDDKQAALMARLIRLREKRKGDERNQVGDDAGDAADGVAAAGAEAAGAGVEDITAATALWQYAAEEARQEWGEGGEDDWSGWDGWNGGYGYEEEVDFDTAWAACESSMEMYGFNGAFYAASYGHLDCLRKYIHELGEDPNQADHELRTLVHFASAYGHVDILSFLLEEAGADGNAADAEGRTPIFYACTSNQFNCCALLLDANDESLLSVDSRGDTPLHAAACSGYSDCLELLLQSAANPDAQNHEGHSAAHLSCTVDVMQCLSNHGANLFCTDSSGRTPLFTACASNNYDVAAFLAEVDEDCLLLEFADKRGDTPLHAAACNGCTDCAHLLLQYAVSPSVRNNAGLRPLQLAEAGGHEECAAVLGEYDTEDPEPSNLESTLGGHDAETAVTVGTAAGGGGEASAQLGLLQAVNVAKWVNKAKAKWKQLLDEESGYYYYYDEATGESRWEAPPGFFAQGAEGGQEGEGKGKGGDGDAGDEEETNEFAEVDYTDSGEKDVERQREKAGEEANGVAKHIDTASTPTGSGFSAVRALTPRAVSALKESFSSGSHDYIEDSSRSAVYVEDTGRSTASTFMYEGRKVQMELAQEPKKDKDYTAMAQEYENIKAFSTPEDSSAAEAAPAVMCTVCSKNVVEHIFLPCEHKCACMMCIEALCISPKRPDNPPGAWTACPLCMKEIGKIIKTEETRKVKRQYGPNKALPDGFNLTVPAAAEQAFG